MQIALNTLKLGGMAIGLLFMTSPAWSRTVTVGKGVGYDYGEIQLAINAAQAGDRIIVSPGTYPGKYGMRIDFKGKNIILTSEDPNDPAVVRDTVIVARSNRVPTVTFAGSEDERCTLQGFTVSNGKDVDYGAGILGNGTEATISHCIISNNKARVAGGGIHDCDGMIRDCTICDNRVMHGNEANMGGGLSECDGTIINCKIHGNDAGDGDGPYGFGGGLSNCQATVQDCEIHDNLAVRGGGLYECDGVITRCLIRGNGSHMSGGGLFGCSGTITDCTIQDNHSAKEFAGYCGGGGLAECEASIVNCTVENNTASDSPGGGLHKCNGSIRECLIKGNSSENSGGGLSACDTVIEDCEIVENKTPFWHGGGAVDCNSLVSCMIRGNIARGYGGGLYQCQTVSGCTVTGNVSELYPGGGLSACESIVNSIVGDNTAGESGGGLHDCPYIVNCTIVNNMAGVRGGAIFQTVFPGTVINSIVWGNQSERGGQALIECSAPAQYAISYCVVEGGLDSFVSSDDCQIQWDASNLISDPRLNGYRLFGHSPCMDAGDPARDYSGQMDVYGRARVAGEKVDIGAHEYVYIPPVATHLAITGPTKLQEDTPAQYNAVLYYDDAASEGVTGQVQWAIIPEHVGSIDISGRLSLEALNASMEIIIVAVYAEGDTLQSAELRVWYHHVSRPERTGRIHVDGINGSDQYNGFMRDTAVQTIQRGIDVADPGETVLVYPGVYAEEIRFRGKAITVQSAEEPAILENHNDFAVTFIYGEDSDSVLKNFIIRRSLTGVFIAGSSPALENLTIVDNESGIECYEGQPRVSNCILWRNSLSDVIGCEVRYSCVQRPVDGQGNISADPLFVNAGGDVIGHGRSGRVIASDFHLRSQAGYWDLYRQTWTTDKVTSPCIDAGDPQSPLGYELFPNGGRINMGAYGGTERASKSYFGDPPCETVIAGDINGDCRVDFTDLAILTSHWLQRAKAAGTPSVVPDPGR